MKDNLVRDSENVIKMYLTPTGKGDAILEKNISLYVGSFQGKLLQVFVPRHLLFENEENTFNYAVSVSALMRSDTGKKVTSKPYYLNFLKEDELLDPHTQEMTKYIVFERVLPKEFTVYVGTTTVVINVINVDNTDSPTMLDIITSQVSYLQVQESEYADGDEEIEVGDFENLQSVVTANSIAINELKVREYTGENYIATLSGTTLQTSEELNQLVQNKELREPKNGDTIIFTHQIEGETDKTYKYIFSAGGWENYEIPLIETADNGSLGIIQGTFNTNDADVTTTEFNVRNGKILNAYVKVNGQKQELGTILNETLPNIYLNKEIGASKQFVRDYAMPREFNDIDFISSSGYQDNVPTEPASGVQFTTTTDDIGDFQLFNIEKVNKADFELSSNNGYTNNIYVSANANCSVTFRLTTKYKKQGQEWSNLNIELSNTINLIAGEIQKIVFSSPFTYLGGEVVEFTNGDMFQQTLEVITQTGSTITFNVYSNEVYPSIFTLTSQSYTVSAMADEIGKMLVLGVDGIIENNKVVFEVQNAEDFIEYKTNQRKFLLFGYLPVVGELDEKLPVNITFGDTTYNVYTFMNGGNNPITIGDLRSVMSYTQEYGYRFYPKMVFIETADIQGFVVEPATVTAGQLVNLFGDTDTIIISDNKDKIYCSLSAEVVNKLSKMLVTPMDTPSSIELVGVGTNNMQVMLTLGSGLVIENNVLKTIGGSGGDIDLSEYLKRTDIVDALNSIDGDKVLSAKQGNVIYNMITDMGIELNTTQQDVTNLKETSVKTEGDQVIEGEKTYRDSINFASGLNVDNSSTIIQSNITSKDINQKGVGGLVSLEGNGVYGISLHAGEPNTENYPFEDITSKSLGIYRNSEGEVVAKAPNPDASSNTNDIATTKFCKDNYGSLTNPNLLINGDFSINTNGHTSYNENNSTYILNNWKSTSAIKVEKIETGIRLSTESATRWYSMLTQNLGLLNIEQLVGKTLTLSAQIRNYTGSTTDGETLRLVFYSDNYTTQISNVNVMLKTGLISVSGVVPVGTKTIAVEIFRRETALIEIELDYIKLEIGSIATAFSPNVVENYFIDNIPSNPNLLINGDFRVNQRGLTTYSSGSQKYCVDRWLINANTSVSLVDNGISVTSNANGNINQFVELPYETLAGKYVTISINISGVVYGATALVPSTKPTSTLNIINKMMSVNGGTAYFKLDYDVSKSCFRVYYYMNTATTYEIRYIKFELGSIATPNTPRPYAEELALCQRYYYRVTAGTAYGTIMECFCKNNSTTEASGFIHTPVTMRPYVSVGWGGNIRGYYSGQTVTEIGYDQWSPLGVRFNVIINSANFTPFYYLMGNNDKTAYVYIDSEIY